MASILDLLGLGSATPAGASTPPPPHQWGYDPQGYLTPQLNGGGQPQAPQPPQGQPGSFVQNVAQQAPAGPLVSAATNPPPSAPAGPNPGPPAGATDSQAPINVQGDNWKPKHDGILGQIADYFLGTHFSDHVMHQNQEASLSQLQTDPMAAVKRMSQFDPQGAEQLYNNVMREQHQGNMEKHYSDVYQNTAENQTMGVVRNMAINVAPDGSNMAGTRAQVVKYMQAKNMPQSLIDTIPGDNATADDWKTFAQGGIPAGRQAALTEKTRNDNLVHGDRQANTAERTNFHKELIPILRQNAGTNAGRLGETISNDTANQGMRQEGIDNHVGPPVAVQSDQGHQGVISNGGKGAYYDVPDGTGKVHRFIRGGVTIQNGRKVQHWIPTGEVVNNADPASQ